MKRKIAYLFMISGVILIATSFMLLVNNNNESSKAKESSDSVMRVLRVAIEEKKIEAEEQEIVADPFEEEMTIKEIDGYGYIGFLTIPALEIELPVMADWDYDRLKISPCRHYGSVKTNNLVIAAHHYRYHFGYIGELVAGDKIMFTDMNSVTYNYEVYAVEVIDPTEVERVKDCGDDLILYTCTYSTSRRIVVRCNLV